jgi:hypothetical protein
MFLDNWLRDLGIETSYFRKDTPTCAKTHLAYLNSTVRISSKVLSYLAEAPGMASNQPVQDPSPPHLLLTGQITLSPTTILPLFVQHKLNALLHCFIVLVSMA